MKSISSAGFKPGEDISICLDVAANELNKPKMLNIFRDYKKIKLNLSKIFFQKVFWDNWKKFNSKKAMCKS